MGDFVVIYQVLLGCGRLCWRESDLYFLARAARLSTRIERFVKYSQTRTHDRPGACPFARRISEVFHDSELEGGLRDGDAVESA